MFARLGRELLDGQRSELTTIGRDGHDRRVVFTADAVIEAPNWTPDGSTLVFNAGGELWKIVADGSQGPSRIDTGSIRDLNNDHVLSPDGRQVYLSSGDGHLYRVPMDGGEPVRVSNKHPAPFRYYLHGISPDGQTLVYVAREGIGEPARFNLFAIPAAGGPDQRLTDRAEHHDGPDFSPDGQWIYFNSERNSPGHAQCLRMRADGSGIEPLTRDDRVNWFPHPSPDGEWVVYLSYPPGTQGHPANLDVELRIMRPDGSDQHTIVSLFGGQGTINVGSWAPDSQRFAYVAYPVG